MRLKELMQELGISNYPLKFEKIYDKTDLASTEFCDIETIENFENKYGVLKEFLPAVIEGARELKNRPLLLAYGNISREYLNEAENFSDAITVPVPTSDKTPACDMLMLFVLISQASACAERYRKRGFSDKEIQDVFNVFHISLNIVNIKTGRPGIERIYFPWSLRYIMCEMFNCGSFNFELRKLTQPIKLLKNKNSEKHTLLMTEGRFHRDGQLLGNPGYTDERDAFDADFSETDEFYKGHISSPQGFVSPDVLIFKKSEWECVLQKGDDVASLHIPRNVDLSRNALTESYKNGLEIIKERFPEYKVKYLYCNSWLIDTRLRDLLGEGSKIAGFGDTFMRYPVQCSGRDGYAFFFLGYEGPDENLPENTSLQRKIKALYLSGGYTYTSSGFITEVHL